MSLQLLQRVDVEVGGRIVDRCARSRFPSGSSGRDGVGRAPRLALGGGAAGAPVAGAPRPTGTSKTRNGGRSANVRVSSGIDTL